VGRGKHEKGGETRFLGRFGTLVAGGVTLAGQSQYEISIQSDRDTYISGMQAVFSIRLADSRGRLVTLQNRYLHASFPDAQTRVALAQIDAFTWRCAAETALVGTNTMRVELRQDHRQETARLT